MNVCYIDGCTCEADKHFKSSEVPTNLADLAKIVGEEIKNLPKGAAVAIDLKDDE
jgi:hypothetical protein